MAQPAPPRARIDMSIQAAVFTVCCSPRRSRLASRLYHRRLYHGRKLAGALGRRARAGVRSGTNMAIPSLPLSCLSVSLYRRLVEPRNSQLGVRRLNERSAERLPAGLAVSETRLGLDMAGHGRIQRWVEFASDTGREVGRKVCVKDLAGYLHLRGLVVPQPMERHGACTPRLECGSWRARLTLGHVLTSQRKILLSYPKEKTWNAAGWFQPIGICILGPQFVDWHYEDFLLRPGNLQALPPEV